MRTLKKGLVMLLAVACLVTTLCSSAFAAGSPVWGIKQNVTTGEYWAHSEKTTHAVKKAVKLKTAKVDTVANTVTLNGNIYKVTKLGANAYKGTSKYLKKINVQSKYLTKVNSAAFRGWSKAKLAKVKIVVTQKMSTKNWKKLVKALKAVGISRKNILRSTKF